MGVQGLCANVRANHTPKMDITQHDTPTRMITTRHGPLIHNTELQTHNTERAFPTRITTCFRKQRVPQNIWRNQVCLQAGPGASMGWKGHFLSRIGPRVFLVLDFNAFPWISTLHGFGLLFGFGLSMDFFLVLDFPWSSML